MGQNGLGNTSLSQAHAKGLAELVRARGGISLMNEDLRSKVHRYLRALPDY